MRTPPYFVGIDVGGQSIKAGVVDDLGKPQSQVDVPTEAFKGQEHGLAQMAVAAERAIAAAGLSVKDIAGIGVATPGTMDIPAGVILEPPNLRPWKNVPVRAYIQQRLGRPTTFQNDANAAAYGEYWVGAGQGARSLVLFTLGTGIGCGIIVDDIIIEGAHSHGAEVGHVVIQMKDGRMCGCGQPGHLEAYASARALVKQARHLLATTPKSTSLRKTAIMETVQQAATPEEEETLDARHALLVFQAAAAGDELARALVDEAAYALAIGAVDMMHTIDPDRIIFAGGMISAGPAFLERIKKYIKMHAFPVPAAKTEVLYAALGNQAGLIGAAGCARRAARGGLRAASA
jgi:glucokinase